MLIIYHWKSEFFIDSEAYHKVQSALTDKRLEKGIRKASPLEQTSCLEGFHSVINQFSPKMIAYSYPGMLCRYVCDIFGNSQPQLLWAHLYITGSTLTLPVTIYLYIKIITVQTTKDAYIMIKQLFHKILSTAHGYDLMYNSILHNNCYIFSFSSPVYTYLVL